MMQSYENNSRLIEFAMNTYSWNSYLSATTVATHRWWDELMWQHLMEHNRYAPEPQLIKSLGGLL